MSSAAPLSLSQRALFRDALVGATGGADPAASPGSQGGGYRASDPTRAPLAFRPLCVSVPKSSAARGGDDADDVMADEEQGESEDEDDVVDGMDEALVPGMGGRATVELGGTEVRAVVSAEVVQGWGGWDVDVECANSVQAPTSLLHFLTSLLRSVFHASSNPIPESELLILPPPPPPPPPTPSSTSAAASETASGTTARRRASRVAQRSWRLSVDVSLHRLGGGNVVDACVACVYAALRSVRLPRTRAVLYGSSGSGDGGGRGERGTTRTTTTTAAATTTIVGDSGHLDPLDLKARLPAEAREGGAPGGKRHGAARAADFELVDTHDVGGGGGGGGGGARSSERGRSLAGCEEWPVCVTVCVLPDGTHLLDPTWTEEEVVPPHRRLAVVANARGEVFATRLLATGVGEAEADEAVHQLLESPARAGEAGGGGEAKTTTTPTTAWTSLDYRQTRLAIQTGARYAQRLHAALEEQLLA